MSSPVREIPNDVLQIMEEIFVRDEEIESPFDDSDADPDFLPAGNKIPQQAVFNKNTLTNPIITENFSTASPVSQISTPSRKRKRHFSNWTRTVTKRLRNCGQEYIDKRGIQHRARTVKEPCGEKCNFKCTTNFSLEQRQTIHQAFWNIDPTSKLNFYAKFTTQNTTTRKRTKKEISRRAESYKYYFEKDAINVQVCKVFFLNTLDVSQNRIYYYYKKNHMKKVGVAKPVIQGNHVKFQTPTSVLNKVRDHIKQFPAMDSHYCRANSLKKYLEPSLNLTKMFNMYKISVENPVKFNMYSKIFNEEFNYSFHRPKKDQCDRCAAFALLKEPSDSEKNLYDQHRRANKLAKLERDYDRKNLDGTTAVICYDLQNVFALPKANVSSFYYRRKFSVFNLTGHCNKNKKTYCAIWHEALSGRSGNDIASALIKILENVLGDNPGITRIILWSDSCIPQNKNRITTLAIVKFLKRNQLVQIEQKFSEPGHSQIQEIDAVHSCIDRNLKNIEIYSPVGLLKLLKGINSKNVTLKFIQMKSTDFLNYNAASTSMSFPPFASIKHLVYHSKNVLELSFRKEFAGEFLSKNLVLAKTRKKTNCANELPNVKLCRYKYDLKQEKIKDLKAMLIYMPEVDRGFYNIYLK